MVGKEHYSLVESCVPSPLSTTMCHDTCDTSASKDSSTARSLARLGPLSWARAHLVPLPALFKFWALLSLLRFQKGYKLGEQRSTCWHGGRQKVLATTLCQPTLYEVHPHSPQNNHKVQHRSKPKIGSTIWRTIVRPFPNYLLVVQWPWRPFSISDVSSLLSLQALHWTF